MADYVFRETDEAADEVTRLFDFVWPTAVALWNLRWQVDGFLKVVPDASFQDVASRFVVGSGIGGADIRAMSRNTTWEEEQQRFAQFILTNVFAIYEGWAKRLVDRIKPNGFTDKDLYREGRKASEGLAAFIAHVNFTPSPTMQGAFRSGYLQHWKVSVAEQPAMLKCYRYFKEIRNTQIHNHGIADQNALDAYNAFLPVSSPQSLGMKGALEHRPVVVGVRTPVSIRGVVGLCDVVLRLMITVDAQLSGSAAAEDSIVEKVRSSQGKRKRTLKMDPAKAERQLAKMCVKAGLPRPTPGSPLQTLLTDKGVICRYGLLPVLWTPGLGCRSLCFERHWAEIPQF